MSPHLQCRLKVPFDLDNFRKSPDMSNNRQPREDFICEPIKAVPGTSDPLAMATGQPGFPSRFIWREHQYALAQILETWKESGPCKSGSAEMYLRKHFFRITTAEGPQMTIYFERQPRSKRQGKARWWLYTVSSDESTR